MKRDDYYHPGEEVEPTLTHDIEQWIQDHSHGDLYQQLTDLRERVGNLEEEIENAAALYNQTNRRVADLEFAALGTEERVAHLEEQFQCREREWELRVGNLEAWLDEAHPCLLYTSPSPRDRS